MKTKQIPAIVMLAAGFVLCIISYMNDFSLSYLIRSMFCVLIGFYILGYIIKIILDMNMTKLDDEFTADDLGTGRFLRMKKPRMRKSIRARMGKMKLSGGL